MTMSIDTLAHTDRGQGSPALLYLPGWCGGREVFDPLLARTCVTRRSISVDLPGHGESRAPAGDFDAAQITSQVLELIDRLDLDQVVPVGLSHAGWVALEVRRALGAARVPAVVLMDWMPLGAPPGFGDALAGLQDADHWTDVRQQLFDRWTEGVTDEAVLAFVDSMTRYDAQMWGRAGREIAAAFDAEGSALRVLSALASAGDPCPALHLYAQPKDSGFLAAQQDFAGRHPWFRVRQLSGVSHFPCLECPAETAGIIDEFLREVR